MASEFVFGEEVKSTLVLVKQGGTGVRLIINNVGPDKVTAVISKALGAPASAWKPLAKRGRKAKGESK